MIFQAKNTAKVEATFETGFVCGVIWREWTDWNMGAFVLTALTEARETGLHPKGQAGDVRTRHLLVDGGKHSPRTLQFRDHLKALLRPHGVDVVLHPEDDAPGKEKPPHLHFEYDPKPAEKRELWGRVE
jgi:hypothetical protein